MISAGSISKFYGDLQAVKGISFEIKEGEITGFLGPNGAGKTTTLRMLTGYFQPDEGSISICGYDIKNDQEQIKRLIGYLPESAPLYNEMLVYDYLEFIAHIYDSGKDNIRKVADECGITGVMHRPIGELSKGYRQRVGLAGALIHDPAVLILDEPTSGLDPNQIIEIRNLIREIGKTKTVILSTHILPEVEATCDRVVIINEGSIVADDMTDSLCRGTSGSRGIEVIIKGTSQENAAAALRELKGVEMVNVISASVEDIIEIITAPGADTREDVFNLISSRGWVLLGMKEKDHSLEQIFRSLTTGGDNA